MKNDKSQLNKKGLLLNKKTLTDAKYPIIRIGNDIYILRKLYILTKDNLYNDIKGKNISFYLKTKMKMKKVVTYSKPLDDYIFIENYQSLIFLVANFCELGDLNQYKIFLFNSDLNLIAGDEQLLNYKDRIIYAKIKQNIKKNEPEKNNSFRTFKKIVNKKILSITQRDDKGQIINNSNKSFFSSGRSSFYNIKPKENSSINNRIFDRSLGSSIAKNSCFSVEKNKINSIKSKILFKKKLKRILIKSVHNSFELKKEDIESNNNSYKISTNIFDNIIKSKNKINELNNSTINDSLINVQLNKSKSELDFLGQKNQRFNQKIFDTEKLFNSFNSSKNEGIQIMNIDKTFNNRQNYFFNNYFNSIIKNYGYSNFLRKKENKTMNPFFDLGKKKSFYINHQPKEIEKIKKINQTSFNPIFDKNNKHFTDLKTIYKYLKCPKLKDKEKAENYKEKESKEISLNKLKDLYNNCLYEIGVIINNINDYFPDITGFIQQFDFFLINKFKCINIYKCLKQYLLYCFIESFILGKRNLSLLSLKNLFTNDDYLAEESYKKADSFLQYLLEKIIETKENKNFDLINFVQSKRNIENFIMSEDFFFSFSFCSNYFNKTQRDIGKRILLTLEIKEKLNFKNYFNYYLYFKDNRTLNIENKLNFINKFLYIVDSGCYEEKDPNLIRKFGIIVQSTFKIDDRTKQLLFNNEQKSKMTSSVIRKINKAFYSMVNFFGNNF